MLQLLSVRLLPELVSALRGLLDVVMAPVAEAWVAVAAAAKAARFCIGFRPNTQTRTRAHTVKIKMLCFSICFFTAAYLPVERACAYLKQGAGCSERSQKRPSAAAAGDRATTTENTRNITLQRWSRVAQVLCQSLIIKTPPWTNTHREVLRAQAVKTSEISPNGSCTKLLHLLLQLLDHALLLLVLLSVCKLHHNRRWTSLNTETITFSMILLWSKKALTPSRSSWGLPPWSGTGAWT